MSKRSTRLPDDDIDLTDIELNPTTTARSQQGHAVTVVLPRDAASNSSPPSARGGLYVPGAMMMDSSATPGDDLSSTAPMIVGEGISGEERKGFVGCSGQIMSVAYRMHVYTGLLCCFAIR